MSESERRDGPTEQAVPDVSPLEQLKQYAEDIPTCVGGDGTEEFVPDDALRELYRLALNALNAGARGEDVLEHAIMGLGSGREGRIGARMLLNAGLSLDTRVRDGTLMHHLVAWNILPLRRTDDAELTLQDILARRPKVDLRDGDAKTALHLMVESLLGDVRTADSEIGEHFIHCYPSNSSGEARRYLAQAVPLMLQAGYNPFAKDCFENSVVRMLGYAAGAYSELADASRRCNESPMPPQAPPTSYVLHPVSAQPAVSAHGPMPQIWIAVPSTEHVARLEAPVHLPYGRPPADVSPAALAKAECAKIQFGKYRGSLLKHLPEDYVGWMCGTPGFFDNKAAMLRHLAALGRVRAGPGCFARCDEWGLGWYIHKSWRAGLGACG
ncbi:hypothetical protein HYH03_007924 [Edaphochlamys debaryana]|uniref:Uncharacterized protein n=1 Tax=Edaphochlamys debaryana TaxID=47281 RepID=A0A835XZQ0_9CHLO|nr:hypothetical protein HYH03_007924 [Edaphochlamys debaryana]|eukprot:KAG2493997.1 hypothetical protein HYH03_007924 [Edaphochlamys debaryana]